MRLPPRPPVPPPRQPRLPSCVGDGACRRSGSLASCAALGPRWRHPVAPTLAIPPKQGTKAITVENNPIPALEDNFNAFNSNGFGYKLNVEGLFYEPLLMFNDLKPNTAYPWLATDFAWNADGTQITFTIRDGVKFSDGTPAHPC